MDSAAKGNPKPGMVHGGTRVSMTMLPPYAKGMRSSPRLPDYEPFENAVQQSRSGTCDRARDRRFDLERRRRVAEMSLEEMRRQLLTSEVTGLPNRRAFDEAGTSPYFALSDLDGLKALNKYGYAVGDAILRAKAEALLEARLDAYHDKGDEFLCRAVDAGELQARLECARMILRNRWIQVQLANGTILRVCGADFSYGVGTTLEDAETRLRCQKLEREDRGELARGELCQMIVAAEELHTEVIHADCPSSPVTSVTVRLR